MNWSLNNIDYHNAIRDKHAVMKFIVDEQLTKQAYQTAQILANEDSLYHRDIPPNGLQNVAQGYRNWVDKPFKCVDLWLNDEQHAFPIKSSSMTRIGVGYCLNTNSNKVYVVANYGK